MANKRHKPEEIVEKLRQADVLVDRGLPPVFGYRSSTARVGPDPD
jgi:hypothetical protein